MPESFAPTAPAEQPDKVTRSRPLARRSRAAGLAATMAGLALLAAGAAGCSSGGNGQTKAGGAAAPAAAPTGIQLPAKIASLTKGTDDPHGYFKDTGIPASVVKNLHSVTYQDSADSTRYVEVSGGPGLPVPSDGTGDAVKRMMSEWAVGAERDSATSVATGSAGGTAECAPDAADAKKYLDCGWVNGKVALVIAFTGFDQTRARAMVPQFLAAMVRA